MLNLILPIIMYIVFGVVENINEDVGNIFEGVNYISDALGKRFPIIQIYEI